ncbi:MAG: hypothetical protein K5633_03520 [Paludibacteraceae bacterium]|nr:hypothetical protein [Paludibacteraceae bacterium]
MKRNPSLSEFVKWIVEEAPQHNKLALCLAMEQQFNFIKDRSVYAANGFSVRCCQCKGKSFSNVVLSLSTLLKYDKKPFLVVLANNGSNKILLSNTTFLKKISHSSLSLSYDNVRGSFLGSDIMKTYEGIPNDEKHLTELFRIHKGFSFEDNFSRLVEATNGIEPKKKKFNPNSIETELIKDSIFRAINFTNSSNFNILKSDLNNRVLSNLEAIIIASHIENVNIRGRLIELLITSDGSERDRLAKEVKNLEIMSEMDFTTHDELGDYKRSFPNGETLTDIKTKVMYLHSNPKAFNIDKFLEKMAEPNTIMFFFFIGISENEVVNTLLCSVYDLRLIDATRFQTHWAGRATRGVAQYNGQLIKQMLLTDNYSNDIDENVAYNFLLKMINR